MWHVCICLLVLVPFLVLCLGENFLKYCYYDSLLFSRMREWFCDVVSVMASPSCPSPSLMKWQMKWHSSFVGYFCLMFRSSRPPMICFFVQWVLHDCDWYLSQIYSCCLSLILVVESVHLKPASLSVFHHIGHLSVSTRSQSLLLLTNDLPNVQDVSSRDLSNVQDISYCNLPNVQNEPYHDSLSERDEPFQSKYCPLASVMFSQNISASRADTHVKCSQVLLANLVHFSLSSVQQIVHILSQRVSRCWLLLTGRLVPFLNLLVPFLSNVYTIFGSRIHINTSFEIISVDNRHVST